MCSGLWENTKQQRSTKLIWGNLRKSWAKSVSCCTLYLAIHTAYQDEDFSIKWTCSKLNTNNISNNTGGSWGSDWSFASCLRSLRHFLLSFDLLCSKYSPVTAKIQFSSFFFHRQSTRNGITVYKVTTNKSLANVIVTHSQLRPSVCWLFSYDGFLVFGTIKISQSWSHVMN